MQALIEQAALEASQRWQVTQEEAKAAITDQLPKPQAYTSDREAVVNILDWFPQFYRTYKQDPIATLPRRVGYCKPIEAKKPEIVATTPATVYQITEEQLWETWRSIYGTHAGGGVHSAIHPVAGCGVCQRFTLQVTRRMLGLND